MGFFITIYCVVSFAIVLAVANRNKERLSKGGYWLGIYSGLMIFYFLLLTITLKYTSEEGNPYVILFPLIATYVATSYLWRKFKKFRKKVVDTLEFKIYSLLAIGVSSAGATHVSTNAVSALTGVPASVLSGYVDMFW